MIRSKFNVSKDTSKRTYDGIVFDSQLEMKYYRDVLCPKVANGENMNYKSHMNYNLNLNMKEKLSEQLLMLLIFLLFIKMVPRK